MKKYEIYRPLKYNDGSEIEAEKFKQIREDLIATFGALTVSSQSAPYQGTWKYGGVDFIDDSSRSKLSPAMTGKRRYSCGASKNTSNAFYNR